eukprot:g3319.t1
MPKYDRSLTVFSPDGRLFQVEYAINAVKQGSAVVGVRGKDAVIFGVEKVKKDPLSDPRFTPSKKIDVIDENLAMAYTGLSADARILVDRARMEAQSYRLTVEDAPSSEYLARHVARIQQRFTVRGGRRPFGVSCLIAGVDDEGSPNLWNVEPSGTCYEWKAAAMGRSTSTLQEYLEANYEIDLDTDAAIKLTANALFQIADGANIRLAVIKRKQKGDAGPISFVPQDKILDLYQTFQEDDN